METHLGIRRHAFEFGFTFRIGAPGRPFIPRAVSSGCASLAHRAWLLLRRILFVPAPVQTYAVRGDEDFERFRRTRGIGRRSSQLERPPERRTSSRHTRALEPPRTLPSRVPASMTDSGEAFFGTTPVQRTEIRGATHRYRGEAFPER